MQHRPTFAVIVALALSIPGTANGQTIDIDGSRISGSDRIVSTTWTTGQTFTPLGGSLVDFSFWTGGFFTTGTVNPFVGEWNTATNSVASVLWSGASTSVNNEQRVTWSVGNLFVDPSLVYVAYLSTTDYVTLARTNGDLYAGGMTVQTSGSTALNQTWNNVQLNEDNWGFQATFENQVSVPEPGSFLLILSGLLGLGLFGFRQRCALQV